MSFLILITCVFTLITCTYLIFYVNQEEIEYWWVQKRNKKYFESEIYKFQRAKVKQRFIAYYKGIGYIDPEASAEEQIRLHERNNEIDKLYQDIKEFRV